MAATTDVGDEEPVRVMLLTRDPGDVPMLSGLLHGQVAHFEITSSPSAADARVVIRSGFDPDVAIIDLTGPGALNMSELDDWRASAESAPTIALISADDLGLGEAAMARGAQDFLLKGFESGPSIARSIRFAMDRSGSLAGTDPTSPQARSREYSLVEAGLVTRPHLTSPRVGFTTRYVAARAGVLGGDFVDCVQIDEDHVRLVVGDVAGHGTDQAAMGVMLRAGWRALALSSRPDEDVLAGLGHLLRSERHSPNDFVTAVDLVADLSAGTLTVRCAGHPPPFVLGVGLLEDLSRQRPLGIEPWHMPSDGTLHQLGDEYTVVVYTDGLFERRLPDGRIGTLDDVPTIVNSAGSDPSVDDILLSDAMGDAAWRDDVAIGRLDITR